MHLRDVSKQMSSSTFSKKLFLGIGSLVVLTFSLGVTVLFSFSSISDGLRTIVHTNAQREALAAALQRRLKRQIRLHTETDPSLIGGAVLRAGDLVIDGSVRSRLNRIAYELTA